MKPIELGAGVNVTGTQYVSSIQATKTELVTAFGEPETDWDKSYFFWRLRFADGSVATVYDWSRYKGKGDPEPSDRETIAWHIGAHSGLTASFVHQAFRAALGLKAGNA